MSSFEALPDDKPFHGGRLIAASREYAIPLEDWVDLSTGVSPVGWPVPELPNQVWRDLPQQEDGLLEAAANYYQCHKRHIVAVPGSQFAIEAIPKLMPTGKVAVPHWGYHEHAYRWQLAGHQLVIYHNIEELIGLSQQQDVRSAVVINPNNPSTELIDAELLLKIARQLSKKGGILLVDEAFNDALPKGSSLCSLFADAAPGGLVVLRSVGKFFGLAGLRLGFAVASAEMLTQLNEQLSPWAVSHPSRWIGQKALSDFNWHKIHREQLQALSSDWLALIKHSFAGLDDFTWKRHPLFVTGLGPAQTCRAVFEQLAQQGILIRLAEPVAIDNALDKSQATAAIRFGLVEPGKLAQVKDKLADTADQLKAQC